MPALSRLRAPLERLLEAITLALMTAMATVVVVAVVYRKLGASLVWYDEVASVMLAWLTYYGAALAALKRAHIGFPGLLQAMPPRARLAAVVAGEAVVVAFFLLLAWVGWEVLEVLETETLVSLPWVPVRFSQSVIPIGAALFVIAEFLVLPEALAEARAGVPASAGAEAGGS